MPLPAHLPARPPGPDQRSHRGHPWSSQAPGDGSPARLVSLPSCPLVSQPGPGQLPPFLPPCSWTWCDSLMSSPAVTVACNILSSGRREAPTFLSRPCLWGWAAPLSPVSLAGPLAGLLLLGRKSMGGHCSWVSWPLPLISQSAASPESPGGEGGCSGGMGGPLGEGIPRQGVLAVCQAVEHGFGVIIRSLR